MLVFENFIKMKILIQNVWSGAQDSVFLISSQLTLMLVHDNTWSSKDWKTMKMFQNM
jgi:hypothetical protein